MNKQHELKDDQWNIIAPMMPNEPNSKGGRPRKDDRAMLNAMIWRDRSGARWRDIPVEYGPWHSVYSRFRKWTKADLLLEIFAVLSSNVDLGTVSIDSTCSKVHQSANGGEKGAVPKPSAAPKAV